MQNNRSKLKNLNLLEREIKPNYGSSVKVCRSIGNNKVIALGGWGVHINEYFTTTAR